MNDRATCIKKGDITGGWEILAKIILCLFISIILWGAVPGKRGAAAPYQVELQENTTQARSASPQTSMSVSESGVAGLTVTLEAEPVQSITEGGIVLTISIKNISQQKLSIYNPLERISIQLNERFHPNLSLPRVLRRHEIYTLDEPDRLRVPYIIREARLNNRSFSQDDMNAYSVRIDSQETLEMTIEIDRLHDRMVKPQQPFPTPPGEYELRVTVILNESKERVLHQFEINPFNFDESKLAIRLEGERLSPADQQRFLETIRANSGNAEQAAEMMTQLSDHPTDVMLPVFLDVLKSERPAAIKRSALQGLSRVKGEAGIELYRQYANDPLLPTPLRSDAIILIGDFGSRADKSLIRQLDQEQNDGLSRALFRAEEKLAERFPPQ